MYVLWAITVLAWLTVTGSAEMKEQKTLTLEEIIPLRAAFFPERIVVQWISDTEFIITDPENGAIVKTQATTWRNTTIIAEDEMNRLMAYEPGSFSKGIDFLMLSKNKRRVYRYSTVAEYFVYDLENKAIYNISHGDIQIAVWGAGRSLAYVQRNNVFYVPDVRRPERVIILTNEGVPGQVYFGVPDWIYEEEVLNAAEAMWFSPLGTYLAVAYFNDTMVETTIYPYYGNPLDLNSQYPHIVGFKYPKAGRENPKVGLRIFKVDDPASPAWEIPPPTETVTEDYILGRVNWASDNHLLVLWLNRRQNYSVLLKCTLSEDKCVLVKEQHEKDGWIDIYQPMFNEDGTKMVEIGVTEIGQSRFMHVTRFSFKTFFYEDMSPTNGTVTEILAWDEEKDVLFYILSPRDHPWQRQLWTSTNGGTVLRCISCKMLKSCDHVEAMFSPRATYGILTCSASNNPPRTYIYYAEENNFRLINDNHKLTEKLSQYKLPMTLFNIIYLADYVEAHVKLYLPPDMDENAKYPMVVKVYAGPGTTRVKDSFDLEYYTTYLAANRSYIAASIDVRGSSCMGLENMFAVNNKLGTIEITDTLKAIRKLSSLYSFIDPTRVGVWGWSYGGYVTSMMLAYDNNRTISCGAAVAPVTSWLYYDTIYTERYMDTPQNNPKGYENSDLLLKAEKLRGKKYLLVHGTGDDNVHFQHSLQFAKLLQHADIEFEQMVIEPKQNTSSVQDSYTDENHSLLGVSRHFYHTLDHFWTDCFNNV